MLDKSQQEYLMQNLRTMQIIVVALAAGVITFIGIVPFLPVQGGGGLLPGGLSYTELGLALAGLAIFARLVVPSLIAGSMRQAIADGKPLADKSQTPAGPDVGEVRPLVNMYQTRLIIGAAFLEGAAFFNVVAYMFERKPVALVAAVVLSILLLTSFPTQGRLRRWAEDDLATIKQLRAMGSQHGR